MARKMDALSEAVWFRGRSDRMRKRMNFKSYLENYERVFGKKKLNIMADDDPFRRPSH